MVDVHEQRWIWEILGVYDVQLCMGRWIREILGVYTIYMYHKLRAFLGI